MMSRRHLLALLCAPAVAHAAPDAQLAVQDPGPLPPWIRLILNFDHRVDLAAIGEACLRQRPALLGSDAEGIYRALARWVAAPTSHSEEILAALPARITADFECGAMESVDGWQLSHTEVLLAVLASKSDLHA
jgi:hypothetical protein